MKMKMKLFRKLKILWVWLLVLTCVPFLSENVCAGEKYTEDIINEDQEAYKIDKENMTISHGDQIYHYKITGESDKPDIYIYFSDGAVYHRSKVVIGDSWFYEDESLYETTEAYINAAGNLSYRKDKYAIEKEHKDDNVDELLKLIESTIPKDKELSRINIGLGIFIILMGIVGYFFSDQFIMIESVMKYDGAEPSEAYSSMAKLSALIMVAIGVGVFLYPFLQG